jgi:hypothetical protein
MRAAGTFEVASFAPAELSPAPLAVGTGLPTGVVTMEKRFRGEVDGRAATIFTAAFDQVSGVGTYVAMESFEGSLNGASGSFNFVHTASTAGSDRTDEHFAIVPSSGTGGLEGIRGTGGIGTDHTIWLEYELG